MKQHTISVAGQKIVYTHKDSLDDKMLEKLNKPYPCFHLEPDNLVGEFWQEYDKSFWEEQVKPSKTTSKYSPINQVFASNKGRIKFVFNNKEEKIISQYEDKDKKELKLDGYPCFEPVHRIIIQTFTLNNLAEQPKDKNNQNNSYIVHHIDNNHWNNCLENLIYLNYKDHVKIKHP